LLNDTPNFELNYTIYVFNKLNFDGLDFKEISEEKNNLFYEVAYVEYKNKYIDQNFVNILTIKQIHTEMTGNRLIDKMILLQLEPDDLINLVRANKYVEEMVDSNNFVSEYLDKHYDGKIINDKTPYISYFNFLKSMIRIIQQLQNKIDNNRENEDKNIFIFKRDLFQYICIGFLNLFKYFLSLLNKNGYSLQTNLIYNTGESLNPSIYYNANTLVETAIKCDKINFLEYFIREFGFKPRQEDVDEAMKYPEGKAPEYLARLI
jgi:hypothetical protein